VLNAFADSIAEFDGLYRISEVKGTKFLTVADALTLHELLIQRYGGSAGIRDIGALESALFRPQRDSRIPAQCGQAGFNSKRDSSSSSTSGKSVCWLRATLVKLR